MVSENDSIRLIFGLKVKSLRQQRGLSYQQLAEKAGLALSYVHDIETGKKFPKADKIIALAKTLGVDYDYLVSLRASKKLQPIIDLLNSDFVNAVPWEQFGLTPASLLDLFSNTPDKVTAFISTLLKISRRYQLSKESFYNSALRSYQDLHDNYFEDLEAAVQQFREAKGLTEVVPVTTEFLESLLREMGVTVDRKRMFAFQSLSGLRSYYAANNKTLYLNKSLTQAQESFLLGREIGFQVLQLTERPYETVYHRSESFDIMLNNFKASYFSAALLMPEEHFVQQVKLITSHRKWDGALWLQLAEYFKVTPEMMMERLTNILPKHFGIDQLFFIRMNGDEETKQFDMTKELHLSQLHNPYGNALHEHYCHRWVSVRTIKEVSALVKKRRYKSMVVDAQISQYWQTHNRYLCLSIAKPLSKDGTKAVSVTIGLLIDQKLVQAMPFVNDPTLQVREVFTTCERCGILDCGERVAPPVAMEEAKKQALVDAALQQLSQPAG